MTAMLASDANNPNFVGATNPDSALHVSFYKKPVKQPFRSEKEGLPIYEPVDYIKIQTPGNALNIIDVPVQAEHKKRFPLQWAHYHNQQEGAATAGLPVTQWPMVDVALAETLKALKFYTVEQIAFASDEQIARLGMAVGMAPLAFREKAKAFLQVAKDSSALQKKDAEIADMKKQLEELAALVKGKLEPVTVAAAPVVEAVQNDERAELSKLYEEKFGKPPHHKMKAATIREKLSA